MPRAELAEGELKQHAGFAETRRRLEEHEWPALEQRGEFGLRRFLAGPRRGEGRAEPQAAQPLPRAQPQREKFRDALELCAKQRLVGRREREALRESAVGFDEAEFGAKRCLM